MAEPRRTRGRPPKYPVDEVRDRLMDSAKGALRANGLAFGVDIATLEGSIEEAEVPRGISYRTWRAAAVQDESPQDAFRHATIADLARNSQDDWLLTCRTFIHEQIAAHRRRETNLQQILRHIGAFGHELVNDTLEIRLVQAFRATAATQEHTPEAVTQALHDGKEKIITEYTALVQQLADEVDVQLRDGRDARDFTEAFFAVTQGITQQANGVAPRHIPRPTGPNGETEQWTLAGISIEALVRQFYDWSPDAS